MSLIDAPMSVGSVVSGLMAHGLMLTRYSVMPTVSGNVELLCLECDDESHPIGFPIWTSFRKTPAAGKGYFSLVELTAIAQEHEWTEHRKNERDGDTADAP